jgi:tetratricopeptide (TPR) repeat protein
VSKSDLTDTAAADERTRFYAPDRAYRLVHGLVGVILRWKRAFRDPARWVIVVRNFDDAHHLGTRFFVELGRRARPGDGIEVIVETRGDGSGAAPRLSGVNVVPAAPWIAGLARDTVSSCAMNEAEAKALDARVADGVDLLQEQEYFALFNFHRSRGDGLGAARMALKMLVIYKGYGYYHEARSFIHDILPHFEQIVGNDEFRRISLVATIDICLAMSGDPGAALDIVHRFAVPFLTKPDLLANMNYILGMHHLRYAKSKDAHLAEQHIQRAVDNMRLAKDNPGDFQYPFLKVFVDNGLAFLQARQGRHQEALDLCRSGYEFITRELGEDRHVLHRSVLLYNIAQVYVMMGQLDEGLAYYRKTILMDPNFSEYHNEVGNILQEQARYQEAIDSYARAIRCSSPYPEVYFNKAVCHARLDEFDAALGCFEISLELNPEQPATYALRADLLRELGRADEALEGYDTAIALGYDSTATRVNRAVLHYNNGSYELALADMDHVIALDPDEGAHYENRAAIHQAMQQEELYLRDLQMAQRCSMPA